MIRSYQDLTSFEIERMNKNETVVLVVLGSIEQHGAHSPLGADNIIGNALIGYLEDEIGDKFNVLLLPLVPYGLSTEHRGFSGTVTLGPETYYHLLKDIGSSIANSGFTKLAFLIAHGGNAPVAQIVCRELRSEFGITGFVLPGVAFGHPKSRATLERENVWDYHGGEMETSAVMAVAPELVKLNYAAGPGIPNGFKADGNIRLAGSAVMGWVAEDFVDVSGTSVGIGGDPREATAEKGEVILRVSARKLADMIAEICLWG